MRVAIYARVSTEAQEARGTIGSQLEVLGARIATEGHELVAEFCDDGYSGARLDRPGLDALRDAAEAGLIEAVWCLSPDRLARAYAYQVVVLDELERLGVRVFFVDTPPLEDPQARLLTQVQGVISEYERAKIAERYRRGKLYRSRAGEVISWKAPYGYRRLSRSTERPAHLQVFEAEAAVCGPSSTTTWPAATPSGRSPAGSTPTPCPRPRASRCGAPRRWGACFGTRPTSGACTTTARRRRPRRRRQGGARPCSAPGRRRSGSRSLCLPSSLRTSSRRPRRPAATTRSGAHGA